MRKIGLALAEVQPGAWLILVCFKSSKRRKSLSILLWERASAP